jgi:trehalose/maltose hydrolase-like predicted phosphorylase
MVFSPIARIEEDGGLPLYPNVGNGYVGGMLGCFRQDVGGEGPTATAGVLHVAGIFNGASTASKRAEIPGVHSVFVVGANGVFGAKYAGSAVDFERGVFYNRTQLAQCGGSSGAVVEQRWYAHRSNRSVLVYEMELLTAGVDGADVNTTNPKCEVMLASCNQVSTSSMSTTKSNGGSGGGGFTLSNSTIKTAEIEGVTPVMTVSAAYKPVPSTVTLSPSPSSTVGADTNRSFAQFIAVFKTSLREEGADAAAPWAAAERDYRAVTSGTTADQILHSHFSSWAKLWSSRIELSGADGGASKPGSGAGNASLPAAIAAAVNASMFYLLQAARSDWPFSTSPGGLANNAYSGHTFWDLETWQFPALAPFYPNLGASLLAYRETRLGEARERAQHNGYAGAQFPWESVGNPCAAPLPRCLLREIKCVLFDCANPSPGHPRFLRFPPTHTSAHTHARAITHARTHARMHARTHASSRV